MQTTQQGRRLVLAGLIACALPLAAHAQTVEVGGAKFDPTAEVAGTKLVLNGAGVRYRAVFKVYAAALYLPGKANTPETIVGMPGAKRVSMYMLRDLDGKDLGKAFTDGMAKNMLPDERAKSINGTFKFGEIFAERKRLAKGDVVNVDWVPNVGATVTIDGKLAGEPIKEVEFYNSVLRIWLGANPPDGTLKDALMGVAKSR